MLTAKSLQSNGVDPAKAKALESIFSGLTLQQIIALIQAILGAIGPILTPTPPTP
jgi:hypothetical protein